MEMWKFWNVTSFNSRKVCKHSAMSKSILKDIAIFRKDNIDRWFSSSINLNEVNSEIKSFKDEIGLLKAWFNEVRLIT